MSPRPRPGILEVEPYVGGESRAPGGKPPLRLASNENPLGPSPRAVEAYEAAAQELHRYPDGASASCAGRWARSTTWTRRASSAAPAPTS